MAVLTPEELEANRIEAARYQTHLPVLRMVLALAQPKRILELGAGLYSTPELLAFPSVESLVSIETSKRWAKRVAHKGLVVVPRTVPALPNLTDFDLVFIDNAEKERLPAINAVLSQHHPIVVIHDVERKPYLAAITEHTDNYRIFTDLDPHTAVVW